MAHKGQARDQYQLLSFLQNHSDRTAVHYQGSSLSYAQLNALLARAVVELDACGLSAGDRVATILPNSLELLLCYYACLLRGVVMVPVNNSLTVAEANRVIAHARPRCLITTPEMRARREQSGNNIDIETIVRERVHAWHRDAGSLPAARDPGWDPNRPAILFYTSGSTGDPKGVVYSWRTLREASRLYRQAFAITERDGSVLCHCFSHNFVLTLLTLPFLDAGGSIHIVDFGNVEQTAGALRAGATFLCLIPWLGYQIVEHFRAHPAGALKLRACLVGGDRVPPDFFADFRQVFKTTPSEMLGMTETNIYVANSLVEGEQRPGSVGQPLPESHIVVRDAGGSPVEAGTTGEIWVKTPMGMAGYWENPVQTRRTLVNGWIATGDAGYLDEDGFLWFTGRIKHIIICDGDNIYPKEVENAVSQHPLVSQACVVGVPHETRGETVAAAVVLRDGAGTLSVSGLQSFVSDRLAATKIPERLMVLDELPHTANGKLDREAVAALLRS